MKPIKINQIHENPLFHMTLKAKVWPPRKRAKVEQMVMRAQEVRVSVTSGSRELTKPLLTRE